MKINNKISLNESLTTEKQVAAFLNPNLYLTKKLEKQKALSINFQTLVPKAPQALQTLTSYKFCYITLASCFALFVHYQLMYKSYDRCASIHCDVSIEELRKGYTRMMTCVYIGMLGCIGNLARALTPYSYDDESISSNCLVKSRNGAKKQHGYVFSSKPFQASALSSLPGVSIFSKPFSITKQRIAPGVCNGMSWWFIILYLYSIKNELNLESRAEKIAYFFKDGAPKQSLFIQALQDFFFSTPNNWKLFCNQYSKLDEEEALKAESLVYLRDYTFISKVFNVSYNNHFTFDISDESTLPDLKTIPEGIYKIGVHSHTMVFIKEQSRTMLFDPNYGLYELEPEQFVRSFNQFCKLYMGKGHSYGILQGISLNSFCFGSSKLFAHTYIGQDHIDLKNPFSWSESTKQSNP
ncbi:hypothetical protein PNK_0169 [Candidatus Protochlamydia naegleriophila]|uniref:Uncharacterized protein n=1 Tax=Candidatus Protochlamydia naegleriophila TaxID=389348 RepID=A0A0U5JBR0_9BACT|nr:hypothetical protein [Candidatus Protochlamydia naegleriophila]CUI15807.1 hypothetical protein PNK_0169 [Candidatus Protochlamydia naegleriophila]